MEVNIKKKEGIKRRNARKDGKERMNASKEGRKEGMKERKEGKEGIKTEIKQELIKLRKEWFGREAINFLKIYNGHFWRRRRGIAYELESWRV